MLALHLKHASYYASLMPFSDTGYRRLNLNTQGLFITLLTIILGLTECPVDDMFLESDIYSPANTTFRIRPDDLTAHISWMVTLNAKMNPGSNYFMEIGRKSYTMANLNLDSDLTLR
jgi:hypothetical protein